MSTAANITIKKNDGTTDIVYGVLSGASGTNPAVWKAPATGATQNTQPELRITSKLIPRTDQVQVVATYMYPYAVVNSTTGVTSIQFREIGRLQFNGSTAVPQATHDEACSQFVNLLASAAVKTQLKELAAAA